MTSNRSASTELTRNRPSRHRRDLLAANKFKNRVIRGSLNLGFTNGAAGTPIVYDMEGYTDNGTCQTAAKSFMLGWVDQLAVAPAKMAGVYGSSCNSYLNGLATIARPPKFIWAANWDGNPSTSALSCVSGANWSNHQRLKPYQGDHNDTWGGATLNIDSNCANGPMAPTGALSSTSVCN